MGGCITREPEVDFSGPVGFNHFHILRAIGKGAFGKVCIVKKKDTKDMYAMKYMNKVQIIHKHAVENVIRESDILRQLEHPFLVNLWFTFQDQEDLFMVLDLMLGGDISYHLEKEGRFPVARVRLYVAELSLALEYLREHKVIHRDVKPANMLLDSGGHVHLTDFNVACIVHSGTTTTSVTGTKPYMAPEVLHCRSSGYSYAVDWWSLGVSVYEMLRGQRPFSIDRHMTNEEIVSNIRHTRPSASVRWDHQTCDLLRMLLHPDEDKRLQNVGSIQQHRFFQNLDWDQVEKKEITPVYIPAQNRIHCDPTHELEEMIVEPNPLHKKQHRLSRRNFRVEDESLTADLERLDRRFPEYNRMRLKESERRKAAGETDGDVQETMHLDSTDILDQKQENGERNSKLEKVREAAESVPETVSDSTKASPQQESNAVSTDKPQKEEHVVEVDVEEAPSETRVKEEASSETRVKEEASSETRVKEEASSETRVKEEASSETRVKEEAPSETRVKEEASSETRVKEERNGDGGEEPVAEIQKEDAACGAEEGEEANKTEDVKQERNHDSQELHIEVLSSDRCMSTDTQSPVESPLGQNHPTSTVLRTDSSNSASLLLPREH